MRKQPEMTYKNAAWSFPLPTPHREAELSNIIMNGSGEDRDMAILEMVNGNMRQVLSLTKRYKRMPDFVDTLFDGNFGLVKAVLTYDHRIGRFSTWSTPKIKTEIRNGILSRLHSPLSVSRYATELAFKIKNIHPDKNGDVTLPDISVTKLAMMGVMDSIPLYADDGTAVEIEDAGTESAFDEVQRNDIIDLVKRATDELGLTDDEITLVSEACSKSNDGSIVPSLAKKWGLTTSSIRMTRAKLLWKIRRKILEYVGKDEYLVLSATGSTPGRDWR